MAGWRLGMAVGNAELVAGMTRVKEGTDSGVFAAVQHAGVAALEGPQTVVRENAAVYQRRRDVVVDALRSVGVPVERPKATIYVWVPVPAGTTSVAFSLRLLDVAGVAVTPGTGYGRCGEGFVRLSLTVPDERLKEAMARIVASWEQIVDTGAPRQSGDGLAREAAL
jgi:LL-diaminopimelate aminotransferase